jgi:hypothetical protein
MLLEKDPDYTKMRAIQEEVAKFNPSWDQTYILLAMIEEKEFETYPGNTEIRSKIIGAYRAATRLGNLQADVWQRLVRLVDADGRSEEAKEIAREAALRGVVLEFRTGQLPQPYGSMNTAIQEAIARGDATEADTIARNCIRLAEERMQKPELIFTLNLIFGKIFMDALMYDSAERHLAETAKRGGTFVYPLAVCLAKTGKVDEGFELLLREITHVPAAMQQLLPAILVLLSQYKPSEEVSLQIDKLIERIERGERMSLKGDVPKNENGNKVDLGTAKVPSRRAQTVVIRFTDRMEENFDPEEIQFIFP